MSQALAKKLVPLMDRVLVERVVAATKTSGGILLPETVGSKVRDSSSLLPIFQSSSSSSSSVAMMSSRAREGKMKTVSKEEWMVFRVDASAFVFISLSLSLSRSSVGTVCE